MEKFLNEKQESVGDENEHGQEEFTDHEIETIIDNIDKNKEVAETGEEVKEFLRREKNITKKKLFNFIRKSKRFIKMLPLIIGVFASTPVIAQENTSQPKNKSEKTIETKSQEQKFIEMLFSDSSNPSDQVVEGVSSLIGVIKDLKLNKVLKGSPEELAKNRNIYLSFKFIESGDAGLANSIVNSMSNYQKYCLYSGKAIHFLNEFINADSSGKKMSAQINKDYAKKELFSAIKLAESCFGNVSKSTDNKDVSIAAGVEIKKENKEDVAKKETIEYTDVKSILEKSKIQMGETFKLILNMVEKIDPSFVMHDNRADYVRLNLYVSKISKEGLNPRNANRLEYFGVVKKLAQIKIEILNNISQIENAELSEKDKDDVMILKDFVKGFPDSKIEVVSR